MSLGIPKGDLHPGISAFLSAIAAAHPSICERNDGMKLERRCQSQVLREGVGIHKIKLCSHRTGR